MPSTITVEQPRLVGPGAHIRIVSPSWPHLFYAPPRAARAEKTLIDMGIRVSYGEFAHEVTDDGMSAGTPEQRASDFMAAVLDPDVDAIMTTGGGATSWELCPHLNPELIRQHAKPFFGYCENIWLHHYLLEHAGLTSYYGVAFMAQFGEVNGIFPESADSFQRALSYPGDLVFEPMPDRTNEFYSWVDPVTDAAPRKRTVQGGWHWLNPGHGEGRFIGGEATYLTRLIDRFEFDVAGAILFWHVAPNDHLSAADLLRGLADRADLQALAGMVVGTDVRHEPDRWAAVVSTALADVLGEVSYPVLANADLGHTDPAWVLPYGGNAILDSEAGLRFPRTFDE